MLLSYNSIEFYYVFTVILFTSFEKFYLCHVRASKITFSTVYICSFRIINISYAMCNILRIRDLFLSQYFSSHCTFSFALFLLSLNYFLLCSYFSQLSTVSLSLIFFDDSFRSSFYKFINRFLI